MDIFIKVHHAKFLQGYLLLFYAVALENDKGWRQLALEG